MATLFGKKWSRKELTDRVGSMSQLGGVRLAELADGKEKGVEIADFRTGSGLGFTVLLSRGMDISAAHYQGRSLSWLSSTAQAHPAYFDPRGLGWLKTFYGGLVTTCGLGWAGAPCTDEGQELGLHGLVSHIPARNVCVREEWEGDEYLMSVTGKVEETVPLFSQVRLTRAISARLGESRLSIDDLVENFGDKRTDHMILYHINIGSPILDANTELISPTVKATPRDAAAEVEAEKYASFLPPTAGFAERVYLHEMKADQEGLVHAALVNRELDDGLGVYIKYRLSELPNFNEWKMCGCGDYVVGMEPANCGVTGRDQERAKGTLQFLEPGEKREYHLEIGVLAGSSEIEEFQKAAVT